MNWAEVQYLHLEISALCNAVCPQCARYPTAGYYEHPNILPTDVWTIDQVKKNLPQEDLINIKEYLLNGTVGDFITNRDALEIVQYLSAASPGAKFTINTNGSARNSDWWETLAQTPNLIINFALDGLADTHALYRRQTDWDRIISNAQTFIRAGGLATWTMTIFEHNQHQIDACRELALSMGFHKFHARHSDRVIVPARDRNNQVTHWLEPANSSPIPQIRRSTEQELRNKEINFKMGKLNSQAEHNTIPLPSVTNCDSLRQRSIYVGGNWSVAPCCFLGILSFTQTTDHRFENFHNALTEAGLTMQDLIAGTLTVSEIVDRGFAWIYDRITTDRALTGCFYHCHPNKSNYRASQATKTSSE
jgi:MoaA/NifB/PqqE/SkfB family radical SAM enzyme